MTEPNQDSPDWGEKVGAWLGARWQWLVVGVLLLFALNNLVGVIVGAVGLILFANRIAGRLLSAGRMAQQVHRIIGDPDDHGDDV